MVHNNLRPAGLLIGRDLDLFLELVMAEGDADRPELVVMVEEDAGWPEMVVVVEGDSVWSQMVVGVEEDAPRPPLASCFLSMTKGITKLANECREEMHGLNNWLAVVQDIWTVTKNGILGGSIRLTTKAMETITIAAVLATNNKSHAAETAAEQLQTIYQERYQIDLRREAGTMASDTTPSAHNAGTCVDAVQQDCHMHVLSLNLCYSLGWNENTRTTIEIDEVCVWLAMHFCLPFHSQK